MIKTDRTCEFRFADLEIYAESTFEKMQALTTKSNQKGYSFQEKPSQGIISGPKYLS